jgi:hypothetical protein
MLSLFEKVAISFAVVISLDFALKIRSQIAWAIAYRKRLPLSYSLMPWSKLVLILITSALGAGALVKSPFDGVFVIMFIVSMAILGIRVSILYRNEVRGS